MKKKTQYSYRTLERHHSLPKALLGCVRGLVYLVGMAPWPEIGITAVIVAVSTFGGYFLGLVVVLMNDWPEFLAVCFAIVVAVFYGGVAWKVMK